MGGKKKSTTVGYKYYVGMSMVLCQGTIDKLINISVADRTAWEGYIQDGQLKIKKDSLFGGESREGGVSGIVDVYSGHDKHSRNNYLVSKISSIVPAYRYVAGLVFRHFYWGNNPYLKDVSFIVQRIHYQDARKTLQWYDEKAEIRSGRKSGDFALHFILDTSASMEGGRIKALKSAMRMAINNLATSMDLNYFKLDILITTYQGGTPQSKQFNNVSYADLEKICSFIDGLSIVGGENLEQVLSRSVSFFKNTLKVSMTRCCIFVSDGELEDVDKIKNTEIHAMINKTGIFSATNGQEVNIYCINVDNSNISLSAKIDNTPEDGLPVIKGTDSDLIYNTIMNSIDNLHSDMNPAHILRELVINQQTGFNSHLAQNIINEESFKQAADVFYQEKLGLSYLWNKQNKFEDLKKNIENTADCVLYQNAQTNQFEIKLIRNDYDIKTLPVFDESNIVKISDIKKNIMTEMINSVTVNFIDREADYNQGSITVRDDALITLAGRENNTTVSYDMVYNRSLATRLAMRDLASLSSDLATVTLTINLDGRMLNRGDVFVINMPQIGLDHTVMRITSVNYGTPKSNQVIVDCIRDVYSLPSTSIVDIQPQITVSHSNTIAKKTEYNIIMEAPYYELVYTYGQRAVDLSIEQEPEIGQIAASCSNVPSETILTEVITSIDGNFNNVNPESIVACELRFIEKPINKIDSSIQLDNAPPEGDYTWVIVDNEIMTIESFTDNTINVKRGCLDTIPEDHDKKSIMYFCGGILTIKAEEYHQSDVVDCRIITTTSTNALDPLSASGKVITMQGRALRPYPPANVTINGLYFPESLKNEKLELSWSSRNRKQQTSENIIGWYEGNVTPEEGIKYHLKLNYFGKDIVDEIINDTFYRYDLTGLLEGDLHIELYTIRDGIESMQKYTHTVRIGEVINIVFANDYNPPDNNNLIFAFEK